MDIWQACKESVSVCALSGELLRIVESQEQIATNALVDTLHEQEILEQLIEHTKPRQPIASPANLHYLLATPFRYPPLPHGSRFGSRHEPSLFYGSRTLNTLLHEAAYYRYVFWYGMAEPPPTEKLLTQHTIFSASYHSEHGLQLQEPPFADYKTYLIDPSSYASTQQLGTAMRSNGIDAFEYFSARDPEQGINIALFSPAVLVPAEPRDKRSCLCETRADKVSFYANEPLFYHEFSLPTFQVDGVLPRPAL